jgi:hypothetical protein
MPDVNATVYWDTTTNGPLVNPDPINVESGTGATPPMDVRHRSDQLPDHRPEHH